MSQIEIVVHTIVLIHSILYLIKIMFELSLGISRFTNFLELANLTALFIICISKYIEIVLKGKREIDMTDDTVFQNF